MLVLFQKNNRRHTEGEESAKRQWECRQRNQVMICLWKFLSIIVFLLIFHFKY